MRSGLWLNAPSDGALLFLFRVIIGSVKCKSLSIIQSVSNGHSLEACLPSTDRPRDSLGAAWPGCFLIFLTGHLIPTPYFPSVERSGGERYLLLYRNGGRINAPKDLTTLSMILMSLRQFFKLPSC